MYGSKRVPVRDLNPHILCALCGGYLIQATTVIECLHSLNVILLSMAPQFQSANYMMREQISLRAITICRSCIVNFLETSKVCPICDVQVHKTRPLLNIRPDQTLQSLVYKLVPGLFRDEMKKRKDFHAGLSESDVEDLSLEERGEASMEKEYRPGDDQISLVLQMVFRKNQSKGFQVVDKRYLLCPSEITVRHLKKFIRLKFELSDYHKIKLYRAKEELTDEMMLQDIGLIYSWKGGQPLHICYTVTESPHKPDSLGSVKTNSMLSTSKNTEVFVDKVRVSANITTCANDAQLWKTTAVISSFKDTTVVTKSLVTCLPTTERSSVLSTLESATRHVATSTVVATPTVPSVPVASANITITKEAEKSYSMPCVSSPVSYVSLPNSSMCNTTSSTDIQPFYSKVANVKCHGQYKSLMNPQTEVKTPTSTAVVSPIVSSKPSISETLRPQPDVSKLMHSVQSILSKGPKKLPPLESTSLFSWQSLGAKTTPREGKQPSSTHFWTEEQAKTETTAAKITSTEESSNASKTHFSNKNCPHNTELERHKSVFTGESNNFALSSFVPKFYKHKHESFLKRSLSCGEQPPDSPQCSNIAASAMEKRNWKKRKLSALDYESSCGVNSDKIRYESLHQNPRVDHSILKSSVMTTHAVAKPVLSATVSPQHFLVDHPSSSTSLLHTPPVTVDVTRTPVESLSHHLPPRFEPRPCAVTQTSSYTTKAAAISPAPRTAVKNNNKTSCVNRYDEHIEIFVKKKRVMSSPSPKESVVRSVKLKTVTKSCPSKSKNSGHNSDTVFSTGETSYSQSVQNYTSKNVEEICVEISTSPSSITSVTSPASNVTSPGTEDRPDNSALPEMQSSCERNCHVVNFSSKTLPLDLSKK